MVVLAHKDRVNRVAFAPGGTLLAAASGDNAVSLWALNTSSLYATLPHPSPAETVAFSPDGRMVASGADDGSVRLWSIADRNIIKILDHGREVNNIAFSPDSALLLVAGTAPAIRVWRMPDFALLQPLTERLQQLYQGTDLYPPVADDAVFAPDGQLGASTNANAMHIWRVNDGEIQRTLKSGLYGVHDICFSPDGALLASAQYESYPELWRVEDGANLGMFHYANNVDVSALSVAFSPDGALLASGATDGALQVWRVSDRAPLQWLTGHTGDIWTVAFSPDGTLLASGSLDGTVRLWPVEP